jgi:pyrroloquinoline quinone biosynthesis protein D
MNDASRPGKPRLIRNCRLSDTPGQDDVLLMPEGMIRLKGTGAEILRLCNGERTLSEIFTELQSKYPSADRSQIESEATDFLRSLREKRVLDF